MTSTYRDHNEPVPPLLYTVLSNAFVITTTERENDVWRYITEVIFLDPWTGESIAPAGKAFFSRTFIAAVDKHHRVVSSLVNRKGSEYRDVIKTAPLARDFSMDALFGKE